MVATTVEQIDIQGDQGLPQPQQLEPGQNLPQELQQLQRQGAYYPNVTIICNKVMMSHWCIKYSMCVPAES